MTITSFTRLRYIFVAALSLVATDAREAAAQTTGTNYQQLMFFDAARSWGANPISGVIFGSDGTLYGTAVTSVTGNFGALYGVATNGAGHRAVVSLPYGVPYGRLLAGPDGALYGTAQNGGSLSAGSIFKVDTDGGGYTNIYSFGTTPDDGADIIEGVVMGLDGALYGTTSDDFTTNRCGVIFKINPDGTGYQILHQFSTNAVTGATVDGSTPRARLLVGRDGALYGTTAGGGSTLNFPYDPGTVFKINPDGTGYQVLHSFVFSDGYDTQTELIQETNGMLFGTTAYGGPDDSGVIFTLSTNGTDFAVLYNFTTPIYGAAAQPSSLALAPDGAFYGTTQVGGLTNATYPDGMGTVFRVNTDGTGYTTIYSFSGEDGRLPTSGVTVAADGTLYGTTEFGGYMDGGVVFKLSSTPPATVSIIDSASTSNGFLLTASGAPAQNWTVQNTASLRSAWQILATTNTDTFGLFQYLDTGATNSIGFYRTATP